MDGLMANSQRFTPQRHEIGAADAAIGMDNLEAHENALRDIEKEIHIATSARRAIAAGLTGIGWRESHHLSEHLAWLLERETDALTAYSLYRAVINTHPQRWTITPWVHQVLKTTPFPMLRAVILDELFDEGDIDLESSEGQALLAQLDTENPDHQALLAEHLWLIDADTKCPIDDVIGMLDVQASMPQKVAAMRIVQFTSDPELDQRAMPALMALFARERHNGLSLKIGDILVRKHGFKIDLDAIAFFIRAWHSDGILTAKIAMGSMLFGVEDFLMDNFFRGEQRQSALTEALLGAFSPTRLPTDAASVVDALTALSTDITNPLAAFAATAALAETGYPHTAGRQVVLHTAKTGADPLARALAIRVLGQQPKALQPLLGELRALCVATDTDPRVRRAAFHAMVNTEQSGLAVKSKEVIDLYFQYLREAPFVHFGDALHGSDIEPVASYFLECFSQSIEKIKSEQARQAAFNLISSPFGFGIATEFEPHWPAVIQLMLTALDQPKHGELHYTIFWNMLHDVVVPKRAAAAFGKGLHQRLTQIKYTRRTRGLIEDWLKRHAHS
jgi:hypothetical protein